VVVLLELNRDTIARLVEQRLPLRAFANYEMDALTFEIAQLVKHAESAQSLALQLSCLHHKNFYQPFAGNEAYIRLASDLSAGRHEEGSTVEAGTLRRNERMPERVARTTRQLSFAALCFLALAVLFGGVLFAAH
jgi:hypothetical protein